MTVAPASVERTLETAWPRRKRGQADTPPAGTQASPTRATGIADTQPSGMQAADTKSRVANLPPRPPGADDIDPGTAAIVAVPQYLGEMKSDPAAAVSAVPATTNEPRAQRAGSTDASELVRALVAAHRELADSGYGLLIHDGYRPWTVTKLFWEVTPKELREFVADPAAGSN